MKAKTRCLAKKMGRGSMFLGTREKQPQTPTKFTFLDLPFHILKLIFTNMSSNEVAIMFIAHRVCEEAAIQTLKCNLLLNMPLIIYLNPADVEFLYLEDVHRILQHISRHVINLEFVGNASPHILRRITYYDRKFIKQIHLICPNVTNLKFKYIDNLEMSYFGKFRKLTSVGLDLSNISGRMEALNNVTHFEASIIPYHNCPFCYLRRNYHSLSVENVLQLCKLNKRLQSILLIIKCICPTCETGRQFMYPLDLQLPILQVQERVKTLLIQIGNDVMTFRNIYNY